MEGGGLFNQAFLGGDFLWWIGQVVDQCAWNENILSGKFKSPESIPGWGRRYKVRIIGIHDAGITAIKDEELPWAQVMYPVTGGGGQANSIHTPNIRQGMMVFGFFMDGMDQQQPVIMGILGNNAQTELKTEIGTDEVTNEQPGSLATSGWAEGKCPPPPGTKAPDEAKRLTRPVGKEQEKENATIQGNPGVLTKEGLAKNRQPTAAEQADVSSSKAEISRRDDLRTNMGLPVLTKDQADNITKSTVEAGRKLRSAISQTPGAKTFPGATLENADAIHELAASDDIKESLYQVKTVLMNPHDIVQSSMKGMQTEMENLSGKINKHLSAIGNYSDAVSNPPKDISKLIKASASENAKYTKVIMDKVMEFTNKTLAKELSKTVNHLPISKRSMFGDMKEIMTQNTLQQFNGIANGLVGQLSGILTKSLDVDNKIKEAQSIANNPLPPQQPRVGIETTTEAVPVPQSPPPTYPKVPICYAEDVVGQVLAANRDAINQANNGVINNLNAFIDDMKSEMDDLQKKMDTVDDDSNNGAVQQITDEEVLNLTRGGTGYVTANDVGTTLRSNVRPGISTTTDGTGLTVDYTVSTGGAGDGYVTITSGGSGYTAGSNVVTSGGSGNADCTVNTTVSAGAVTAISIASTGTGYKTGDDLTISGGGGNATFKIDQVVGGIDAGSIIINQPGVRYTVGDVCTVNAGDTNATFTITSVVDPGTVKMTPPPKGSRGAPPSLSDMLSNLGNLTSSLTSALNFKNIVTNIFPFELPPIPPLSDFYTLASGSSGQPDQNKPSNKAVADRATGDSNITPPSPEPQFVTAIKPTNALGELANIASAPLPIDPEAALQSRVLDSMGERAPGTSVHRLPGGAESYWSKLEQERPLNNAEKRWRDRGRDQWGRTVEGEKYSRENPNILE